MPIAPAPTLQIEALRPRTSVPASALQLESQRVYFQLPAPLLELGVWVLGRADPPTPTLQVEALLPVFIRAPELQLQALPIAAKMPIPSLQLNANPLFAFVEPSNANRLPRVMRCRLIADSLSDLSLPISSFNARLSYGKPSYISVVVPAVLDLVDDIDARKDGTIIVDYGYRFDDGSESLTELGRVALQNINQSQGASSFSAVLDGYQHDPNPVPKEIELEKIQFINTVNGIRRVRAPLDVTLRPGDQITLPDSSRLVAGTITYTVNTTNAQMEVSEIEDYDLLTDTNNPTQGDTVTDANGNVTPVLPWTISTDSSAIN